MRIADDWTIKSVNARTCNLKIKNETRKNQTHMDEFITIDYICKL